MADISIPWNRVYTHHTITRMLACLFTFLWQQIACLFTFLWQQIDKIYVLHKVDTEKYKMWEPHMPTICRCSCMISFLIIIHSIMYRITLASVIEFNPLLPIFSSELHRSNITLYRYSSNYSEQSVNLHTSPPPLYFVLYIFIIRAVPEDNVSVVTGWSIFYLGEGRIYFNLRAGEGVLYFNLLGGVT